MHLDLSTLTIPPADVVPEPTAEDIGGAWPAVLRDHETDMTAYLCVCLARRCRELEAEVERLNRELAKANCPVGWSDK